MNLEAVHYGIANEEHAKQIMEHLYGHGDKAPNHIERSEGVRTRRWKYINYIDQSGPLSEELYD